jgi:hypothetical protein
MNYANQQNLKFCILATENQKEIAFLLFKIFLSMKLLNFIERTGGIFLGDDVAEV